MVRTAYLDVNAKQLAVGRTLLLQKRGRLFRNMEMYHEEADRCSRADDRDCGSDVCSDRERGAGVPVEPCFRRQRLLIADKLRFADPERFRSEVGHEVFNLPAAGVCAGRSLAPRKEGAAPTDQRRASGRISWHPFSFETSRGPVGRGRVTRAGVGGRDCRICADCFGFSVLARHGCLITAPEGAILYLGLHSERPRDTRSKPAARDCRRAHHFCR